MTINNDNSSFSTPRDTTPTLAPMTELLQEQVRNLEEKFRTLTICLPVGIYLTDAEGRCQYVNKKWCEIAGLKPEQALGDGWKTGLHADDRKQIADLWERMLSSENQWGCEYRFENSNGNITWVYGRAAPFYDDNQELLGYVGSNVDIAKLKETEETLRESEQRFRAIANYIYDWETWFGPTGEALWINPAVERITGYSVEECLSMENYPLSIVVDDDKEIISDVLEQGFQGKSGNNQRFRITQKNGSVLWLAISWQPICDEEEHFLGLRTSIRDIDKHAKAEHLLVREQERFKLAMDAATEGLWDWNIQNDSVYYSPMWAEIIGGNNVEDRYNAWESRIHPADKAATLASLEEHLNGQTHLWSAEHRLLSQSGDWKWVLGRGQVISRDENGIPLRMIGTMKDISERKALEEKMYLHQKHLRELNSRISFIESQERRRIAEEIHDRLVQPLIFLDIQLSQLLKKSGHDSLLDSLTKMRTDISELVKISRNITCDLSSPLLHELGLDAAVEEWLEREVRRKHKLKVNFSVDMDISSRKMTSEINELLFKCIKELTINTIKHAKATRMNIMISEARDCVELSVADNGVGFELKEIEIEMNGFGLFNICEKVQYVGGKVNIDSSADSGSRITLTVPIGNP